MKEKRKMYVCISSQRKISEELKWLQASSLVSAPPGLMLLSTEKEKKHLSSMGLRPGVLPSPVVPLYSRNI